MDAISKELEMRGIKDLANNTEDRMPCLLMIDTSSSMNHGIVEIISGLNELKMHLMQDPVASRRVQIAVMTYGGGVEGIKLVNGFVDARSYKPPKRINSASDIDETDSAFRPNGATPMGRAVCIAVDEIQKVKTAYRNAGISFYRPWILNLTDGGPNDGEANWIKAKKVVADGIEGDHFVFFNLGTEDADFNMLKDLSSRTGKIKGQQWGKFFAWLSNSLKIKSHSQPSEEVPLPAMGNDFFSPA